MTFSTNVLAAPIINPNNGHYYDVIDTSTWDDAETAAQWLGGHLVTVNDQAEQDWLQSTFGDQLFWIGYNDIASEGNFVWTSGETPGFTYWAAGEPNDLYGNEDRTVMNWNHYTGQWNDLDAGWTAQGIAEWAPPEPQSQSSEVPEPATLSLFGLGLAGLGYRRRRRAA